MTRSAVLELVSKLRELDIALLLDGDQLRINAPAGVLTADLRAELAQHKADLIALLRDTEVTDGPPLKAMKRTKPLPLSFAQQRLWFLDQLDPGSVAYNLPMAIRLSGALDVSALERALSEIIARHEILRTTFWMEGNDPVQVIGVPASVAMTMVDLRALAREESDSEVRRLILEDINRPFDLQTGPLFRPTLLALNAHEHVLLLTMHHIISDEWSEGVFFRELANLYEAFSAGLPSSLSPLPIQYADYAQWQRAWLSGATLDRHVTYWREQLAGAPAVLALPSDHPRPAARRFQGAGLPVRLPKERTTALHALSLREGCTLFMTLLAAWQTVLARYSGQDDIVVGVPMTSRAHVETESMIGFFINTLALRTNLSGDPSFVELLSRVRETTLGAYAHQDLPFERLVEILQPERSQSYSPIFQVMLVLQNTPSTPPRLGEVRTERIELADHTAKFDLTLALEEEQGELVGLIEYDTDLFERTTITRLVGHFETLLGGVTADPGRRLSQLPLLTEPERRQLLVEWNDTAAPYPSDRCIHQLFEEQAARTPDATAVVFEDRQLTYVQLNERANQLAHRLVRLGVGPERLVGLCVERSLDMIVGVLGILKAGGAYVPMDPAYPKNRLAFMLEDAQVTALVTQTAVRAVLPATQAPIILLDEAVGGLTQESSVNPTVSMSPNNLVYIIYTSGSTGKPKAVPVNHRSLVNTIWATRNGIGLKPKGTVVAVISLSFDPAGLEIYTPMVLGARVMIAGQEVVTDGARLAELLRNSDADLMVSTPAGCRMLLASGWSGQPGLIIFCGSEAMTLELARSLLERGIILWNGYGPTEITIFATWCRVTMEDQRISIGRPIANVRTYILDPAGRPVPIGITGELCIGGVGPARGYLNQPELTAERFVPDPFGNDPDARMYRTGDLARYLPDGTIECLGRIDHQVKVRGFRVELGEIEAVLRSHPLVREAAVIAVQTLPGMTQLTAYVEPVHERAVTGTMLRTLLREQVPDYMVPATFAILDALPKTPNGKLDRGALDTLDVGRNVEGAGFEAPRTPTEKLLAEIWGKALGVIRVGIHDNFFELGGHSLLVAQMIAQVQVGFGVTLPIRLLFERPTIAQLAEELPDVGEKAGTIPTAGDSGPNPISPKEARSATRPPIIPLTRQARQVIQDS